MNGEGVHVRPAPATLSNIIPFVVGMDSLTCRAVANVSGGGDDVWNKDYNNKRVVLVCFKRSVVGDGGSLCVLYVCACEE